MLFTETSRKGFVVLHTPTQDKIKYGKNKQRLQNIIVWFRSSCKSSLGRRIAQQQKSQKFLLKWARPRMDLN